MVPTYTGIPSLPVLKEMNSLNTRWDVALKPAKVSIHGLHRVIRTGRTRLPSVWKEMLILRARGANRCDSWLAPSKGRHKAVTKTPRPNGAHAARIERHGPDPGPLPEATYSGSVNCSVACDFSRAIFLSQLLSNHGNCKKDRIRKARRQDGCEEILSQGCP